MELENLEISNNYFYQIMFRKLHSLCLSFVSPNSGKPGRNVQHYERALLEIELARQRKQDILAYIVHFGQDDCKPPTFLMRGPMGAQPGEPRIRLIGFRLGFRCINPG